MVISNRTKIFTFKVLGRLHTLNWALKNQNLRSLALNFLL